MAETSKMYPIYYHYRVEFQMRGAGHVHGVLWLDEQKLENDFPGLNAAFAKLRIKETLNDIDQCVLARFIDSFVCCKIRIEGLGNIIGVQIHHHTKSCIRNGVCRFEFPRYPSEITIIAQPLDKKLFTKNEEFDEKAYKAEKERHKRVLVKVKKVLKELSQETLETLTIKEILQKSKVTHKEYYNALKVSDKGITIILKREPCDVNVNNYNPEWLKAWNGNMDIQICLDLYAVITYITDYYMKSESGIHGILTDAAKKCSDLGRVDQMKYLANMFLTHRVIGECEAYYKIFPHLHLSDSNIACNYIDAGFEKNRSKLLTSVSSNDKVSENHIQIEGKEGCFKATVSNHDKYANRPAELEQMCFAQFCTTYNWAKSLKQQRDDGNDSRHRIVSWNPEYETDPPSRITIIVDGKKFHMKTRNYRSVLRWHKYREDKNPHEFVYSQLLLYRPWRSENELYPEDMSACVALCKEMEESEYEKPSDMQFSKIEKVQQKMFPYMNYVDHARNIIDNFTDRPTHIGDQLDAENEMENDEGNRIGVLEDSEFSSRYPDQDEDAFPKSGNSPIRSVLDGCVISEIGKMSNIRSMARSLDSDQRMALDIIVEYAKKKCAYVKGGYAVPKPPLLCVSGGAGTGKSHFIRALAVTFEYWMTVGTTRRTGNPFTLLLAPTGKAASIIEGTTLHSAFNFSLRNEYFVLNDQNRENKQELYENLSLVILDEMSMVSADLFYRANMRLKELKRNSNSDFGGVAVVLCGDLMQLPPVHARWIFAEPSERYVASWKSHSLWEKFSPIVLTRNHRQGSDKNYGDILNRIRMKKQTVDDIKLLLTRTTNEEPEDAMYVYGKREPCFIRNTLGLAKLDGREEIFEAIINGPNGYQVPIGKYGNINTDLPFLKILKLKIGARVMLSYNVDVPDCLTNGTTGTVVGFYRKDMEEKIKYVLIEFDEEKAGKSKRMKMRDIIESVNKPSATPIEKLLFPFRLGKGKKSTAQAVLTQFPIYLAFAITAHKAQGLTVKAPTLFVTDLNTVFERGMAYVILGRIQNINQLYFKPIIVGKEGTVVNAFNKLVILDENAEKETKKMFENAINNEKNRNDIWFKSDNTKLKISSLNIAYLKSRMEDLTRDFVMMKSDIICLQETSYNENDGPLHIDGFTFHGAGQGRNQGVAIFVTNVLEKYFKKEIKIIEDYAQFMKLEFGDIDIITIYRSPNEKYRTLISNFNERILELVNIEKRNIIVGDFNFDALKDTSNSIKQNLEKIGFKQCVKFPTHIGGRCLDHVYCNRSENEYIKGYYTYYTDHSAVCVIIDKLG